MTAREIFALQAKGYTLHDGGPRPASITADARPGVALADGSFIKRGELSALQIDWSQVRGWKQWDRSTALPGKAFDGTRPHQQGRGK